MQNTIQAIITEDIDHIFFDETLICLIEKECEIYVPLKPICDALKLNWLEQYKNSLQDRSSDSIEVSIAFVGKDHIYEKLICCPFDYISDWLHELEQTEQDDTRKKHLRAYDIAIACFLEKHFISVRRELESLKKGA